MQTSTVFLHKQFMSQFDLVYSPTFDLFMVIWQIPRHFALCCKFHFYDCIPLFHPWDRVCGDKICSVALTCIEQVELNPCDTLSLKHEFSVSLSPYTHMRRNIFLLIFPGLEMIASLYGGELVEFGADAFETEGCLSHTPPPETSSIVCAHMKRRGFKFPPFLLPNWISPTLIFKQPSVHPSSLGEPPHQTACLFLIVSLRA